MIDLHAEQARYAQRRLDEFLKPVDERLYAWGAWARAYQDSLYWPKQTLLGRMIREGLNGAAQATNPPIDMPEEIHATDVAVAKLPDIRKKVIKIAYLWYPSLPADAQRRKLKMSIHRWRNCLRDARIMVSQNLGITLLDK